MRLIPVAVVGGYFVVGAVIGLAIYRHAVRCALAGKKTACNASIALTMFLVWGIVAVFSPVLLLLMVTSWAEDEDLRLDRTRKAARERLERASKMLAAVEKWGPDALYLKPDAGCPGCYSDEICDRCAEKQLARLRASKGEM